MRGAAPRPSRARLLAGRPGGLRTLLLVPLALVLGACIDETQEQEVGDHIAAQINAQVPLVRDPALNAYLDQLGGRIARHSGRPEVPYRFYIVNTDALNAFALPGGHIYVNRGLIERTSNLSELAGILAHEVAHVDARHGAHNLQRQLRTRSMARVMYQVVLGREPLVDHDALQLGERLWHAQHSRADEAEADRLAVGYLVASGVDPQGMLTMFQTLREHEEETTMHAAVAWFSTHPTTAARIRKTQKRIREVAPHAPPRLDTDHAGYPLFLARLRSLPPPIMHVVLP